MALSERAKRLGGVDLAVRYNPVVRARVQRVMEAFDKADLPKRHRLADALTARMIHQARRTRYGAALSGDYAEWPVLHRCELRDNPERFAVDMRLHTPAATGGTQGQPMRLWRSPTSVAAEQTFLDQIIAPHGFSWRSARIASLRGDMVKDLADSAPPFGRQTHRGRRLILSSAHLRHDTLAWFLDRLGEFQPDILWIWPSVAANLLLLTRRAGRTLRIPLILVSSELLEPELRCAMAEDCCAAVLDYYGMAERSCLAVSRRAGAFHFIPAYGRVELIPAPEDEITNGFRHIAIVATGYWNDAMPLIRYDTGDRALVPASASRAELSEIELGLAPFAAIAGRSDEFLLSAEGTRISGLNQLPREVRNLLQLQIEQRSAYEVVIRALVDDSFGPVDRARLEANARAKIPPDFRINLEIVDRLENSASGKTPFVIRRNAAVMAPDRDLA